MQRKQAQTLIKAPANVVDGPYRLYPPVDPAVKARVSEALHTARIEARRLKRTERWLSALAAAGFIAAGVVGSPAGVDGSGGPKVGVWVPVAASATYALVCAAR